MTVQETFGKRLKEAMKANGYTETRLAREVFISQSSINFYIQGKRKAGYETLVRIADLMGVSLDYLFGRTDEKTATMVKAEKEQKQEAQAELNEAMRKIFDAYGVDVK